MSKKVQLVSALLLVSISLGAWAQDPSIHEVYQVAERGQPAQAQHMMEQVLKDHPASGKAHFVEAELLARQGQLGRAREELARAEGLQPGLPFAQATAVNELRAKLAQASAQPLQAYGASESVQASNHLPWGWIAGAVALVGLGFAWLRARPKAIGYSQAVQASPVGGHGGYGGGFGAAPPIGALSGAGGGGLGSQMLGGLATGAAVGAGVIAGEALMHRFLDDGEHRDLARSQAVDLPRFDPPQADASDDMGGQDFGLRDAGGWDNGSVADSGDDGWG